MAFGFGMGFRFGSQGGGLASSLPSHLPDGYAAPDAAYGFRLVSASYADAIIRIRRSSDDAEADIGADANGLVDTAEAEAFCGAGNGFITTLYDLSGNGRHATQSTAGSQPQCVSSGTFVSVGGMPAATFDGSNDFFALPDAALPLAADNDISIFIVAAPNRTGRDTAWGAGLLRRYPGSDSAGSWSIAITGEGRMSLNHHLVGGNNTAGVLKSAADIIAASPAQRQMTWLYDGGGGAAPADRWTMAIDGGSALATSTAATLTGWGSGTEMGRGFTVGAYHHLGTISEVLIYHSAKSRGALEAHQLAYWGLT